MRFLFPATAALLLAACAGRTPTPVQPAAPVPQPQPVQRGALIGQTVNDLGARFGAPTFQVREGPGLKLQWSDAACVLDVYLYSPPGGGVERSTFAEARRTSGDPADQAACVAALDAAR